MNLESRLPRAAFGAAWLARKTSAARIATAIVLAIAGSAFAQVKPKPPGPAAPRQQICIEMKVIETGDGALGLSVEKGGERSRHVTPELLEAELAKLAQTKGADILSAPTVITGNAQRAIVEIGKGGADPDAGIKIDILPEIDPEGILLHIDFKSKRAPGDPKNAGREAKALTSHIGTFVSVKDGSTILLGGESGEKGRVLVLAATVSIVAAAPENPKPQAKPVGKWVPGKNGFVTSPFAPGAGAIDVRGFPPGTEIKDPHSGKIFLVPDRTAKTTGVPEKPAR